MPIVIENQVAPTQVGNLALATGQGIYAQRQQELANQQRLQYAQLAQQDLAQQRQIAASQQAMQYQHIAGLQDRMLGAGIQDYFGQQRYSQQQQLDAQNFEQQKQYAQLQNEIARGMIPFELNEQGKAKKAYWDQQETGFREFAGKMGWKEDSGNFQAGMKQVAAGRLGTNWQMFKGADPPDIKKLATENYFTDEERGLDFVLSPDGSSFDVKPNKKAVMAEAEAGRKYKIEQEMSEKAEARKMQAENLEYERELRREINEENNRVKLIDKFTAPNSEGVSMSHDDAAAKADEILGAARKSRKKVPAALRGLPGTEIPVEADAQAAAIWDHELSGRQGVAWKDIPDDDKPDVVAFMQEKGLLPLTQQPQASGQPAQQQTVRALPAMVVRLEEEALAAEQLAQSGGTTRFDPNTGKSVVVDKQALIQDAVEKRAFAEAAKRALEQSQQAQSPVRESYAASPEQEAAERELQAYGDGVPVSPPPPKVDPMRDAIWGKPKPPDTSGEQTDVPGSRKSLAVKVSTPADVKRLPSGTWFETPDGKVGRAK